jgi:hypothetical protein
MQDEAKWGITWRRLLAEGMVIVASILIAFGLDAWWGSRNGRAQERALLVALAQDFGTARDDLHDVTRAHETVLASMVRLLTYTEAGVVPDSERAQVDTVLSRVFIRRTFDPPMGTVETILSSGRLDIIRNQDLVAELTRWTAAVRDFNELETSGATHFYSTLYPYLAANLDLQDLDKGIPWEVPWPHDPTPAADLVRDPAFRNVIYMHYVLYHNVLEGVPDLERAVNRIIDLTTRENR